MNDKEKRRCCNVKDFIFGSDFNHRRDSIYSPSETGFISPGETAINAPRVPHGEESEAMKQAKLLNYTTSIDPMKTIGEITGTLVAHGAKSISTEYAAGEPTGISFAIDYNGNPIIFRLPCNYEGAWKAIKSNSKITPKFRTLPQAKRVAWRILKDWVEAQMAIVQCNQAEMVEVFLSYVIVGDNHQTLFQRFKQEPRLLLSAGTKSERPDNVIEGDFQVVNE